MPWLLDAACCLFEEEGGVRGRPEEELDMFLEMLDARPRKHMIEVLSTYRESNLSMSACE